MAYKHGKVVKHDMLISCISVLLGLERKPIDTNQFVPNYQPDSSAILMKYLTTADN